MSFTLRPWGWGPKAVAAVYPFGAVNNKVSMAANLWVITGVCVWIGSLLFAAFGLLIGYVLPAENVMQIMGAYLDALLFRWRLVDSPQPVLTRLGDSGSVPPCTASMSSCTTHSSVGAWPGAGF